MRYNPNLPYDYIGCTYRSFRNIPKISLVMLTRNDTKAAIKNLNKTKESVDEQIVIDSSNLKEKKNLLKYTKSNSKLKVYAIPALGIPETTMAYAIKKCFNEVILLLDSDEEPCNEFLIMLKKLDMKADLYYITRYEHTEKKFATQQLRLFRKNAVSWRGFSHEHPIIKGKKEYLNKEFYLIHNKIKPSKARLKEYERQQHMRAFGPDTFIKLVLKDAFVILKTNPKIFIPCLKENIGLLKTTPEERAIAKITSKIGIVNYLGLNNTDYMEKLTKEYKNKEQGVNLLLKLLHEKYQDDEAQRMYSAKSSMV